MPCPSPKNLTAFPRSPASLPRGLVALILAGAAWLGSAPGARAAPLELPDPTAQHPPHLLASASLGVPLRVVRNLDLGQERLAPPFVDVSLSYLFLSTGSLLHGASLGVSTNLASDGGYTTPVAVASQWVITPAYAAMLALGTRWLLRGHLGVPLLVGSGGQSMGGEVALGLAYRVTAGVGVLAEASFDVFPGQNDSLHPMAALELGVLLDYEVLP